MTYNVFGGTLNLAQSINLIACADELTVACCVCISMQYTYYVSIKLNVSSGTLNSAYSLTRQYIVWVLVMQIGAKHGCTDGRHEGHSRRDNAVSQPGEIAAKL